MNLEQALKTDFTSKDLCELGAYSFPQRVLCKLGLSYLMDQQSKAEFSDNVARIAYSWVVGTLLEVSTGRSALEIAVSRTNAMGLNAITGGIYSRWREGVYQLLKTTSESSKTKKAITETVALASFEPYGYALAITIGTIISGEKVNLEQVREGMVRVAIFSPLIGPTLGYTMNFFSRYVFHTSTVTQRVEKKNLTHIVD